MPTEALRARLHELQPKPYSTALKTEIDALIASIPDVTDAMPKAEKVALYVFRAQTLLLLPTYSAEAEADLNKALKLAPGSSPDPFIALSECLWRKNQEEEAVDAVQSALRIDPKHTAALCLLSRLLRALAGKTGPTPEQKTELLQQSASRAKEAVGTAPANGEAWASLGLAIVQISIHAGVDYNSMSKALAALNQAVAKLPDDPDVHYNRGVVLETLGHFSEAALEMTKAGICDPVLKKVADANAVAARKVLDSFLSLQRELRTSVEKAGAGKGAAPGSLLAEVNHRLPQRREGVSGTQAVGYLGDVLTVKGKRTVDAASPEMGVSLYVCSMLSAPNAVPMAFHCVDREGVGCMLLIYRIKPTAIRKKDVVTVPFPQSSAVVVAHPAAVAGGDAQPVPTVFAEPQNVILNGSLIPDNQFFPNGISSRLF